MTFTASDLYNCCTNAAPPDWSVFAWLEIGGCTTETNESTGDTWTNGGVSDAEAEFWTVYGRLKEGGCEAITDCDTHAKALAVSVALSEIASLPVR